MSNKERFFLIQIIIVCVSLGILEILTVPSLADQIENAQASEAMDQLAAIKRAAISCYDAARTMASCRTWTDLGLREPSAANFSYTIVNSGTDSFRVLAARVGGNTSECIKMEVIGSSGATGITGYGPYSDFVTKATSVAAGGAGANCASY